jgi:hypothetical protein
MGWSAAALIHIHLSKPLHGWRQFVGEVRILLAITANKRVQAVIAVVRFLFWSAGCRDRCYGWGGLTPSVEGSSSGAEVLAAENLD